jgi:hypothetical protein
MSNRIVFPGLALGSDFQRNGVDPHAADGNQFQRDLQCQEASFDSLRKGGTAARMKKLTLLLLVLSVSAAYAATLQILSLDEMTAVSSAIVQGRILASRSDWTEGKGSLIVTYYTVQADSYLKGNLGRTFELTEPGGNVGNLVASVPGSPSFQVGEQVVLFVQTNGARNFHQAIGFEQGVFRLRRDSVSGALTVNHSQPLAKGGQVVASDENPSLVTGSRTSRDLNQFLSQVGESVRRAAAPKKGAQ